MYSLSTVLVAHYLTGMEQRVAPKSCVIFAAACLLSTTIRDVAAPGVHSSWTDVLESVWATAYGRGARARRWL